MDRLAHRVLAGPPVRLAQGLRHLAQKPEHRVPELEAPRTAAQAAACYAGRGAL
jgi:hypothetical protein